MFSNDALNQGVSSLRDVDKYYLYVKDVYLNNPHITDARGLQVPVSAKTARQERGRRCRDVSVLPMRLFPQPTFDVEQCVGDVKPGVEQGNVITTRRLKYKIISRVTLTTKFIQINIPIPICFSNMFFRVSASYLVVFSIDSIDLLMRQKLEKTLDTLQEQHRLVYFMDFINR